MYKVTTIIADPLPSHLEIKIGQLIDPLTDCFVKMVRLLVPRINKSDKFEEQQGLRHKQMNVIICCHNQ